MKMLELTGTPTERGRQHGEAARDEILANIETYRGWFLEYSAMEWNDVLASSANYLDALAGRFPSLHEEVLGIARGAGVDVTEIGALNARTEIAYGASGLLANVWCECTSVSVEARATKDGHLLVAQNWDWLSSVLPNFLSCLIHLPNGTDVLTFTEAGMLGKFGVNSNGVAVCANLLASNRNGQGQTFHAMARAALEASTLTEALQAVTGSVRAGSGNFMIAAAESGECADIEWAPGDFAVLVNDNGVLAHANNFTAAMPDVIDRGKLLTTASPGTYLRTRRAQRWLDDRVGSLDAESLKELLRDHRELPEAICRHEDVPGSPLATQSNMSVIIDLTAKELHWTEGPPCLSDYQVMRFPWADEQGVRHEVA